MQVTEEVFFLSEHTRTLSSQPAASLQIVSRLPSKPMGADTQQKKELPLCRYFKAWPELWVASLCVAPQVGTVTGGFIGVPSWASGSMPNVDKASYRLLSAHSVRTRRKESIRPSSQQRTLIFDF